jgi:arylsulfatase A-like enzyme
MGGVFRVAMAACLLALALAVPGTAATAEPDSRPNIVVFLTDDQPLGTMEAMPATAAWFQEGGTWFPNAVVTSPICCPSRSTIFSGRYAHNHGVTQNASPELTQSLDQSKTVQNALKEAGYRTGIAGKYLNSWPLDIDPPHFDRWATHSSSSSYWNPNMNVDGTVQQVPGFEPDLLAGFATAFLDDFETTDDQPFFLYLAPVTGHKPFASPQRHRGAAIPPWDGDPAVLEADRSDKPQIVRNQSGTLKEGIALAEQQKRSLLAADDMVDEVMTHLVELGEEDNTLAFFLSDNGLMWAHHGVLRHKRLPYTSSVGIPFGMRWPGHVDAGEVDGRIVANVDIVPTIAEAAGLTLGWEPDGLSLLDRLAVRSRILLEYFRSEDAPAFPSWASTLTASWQFTEYYSSDGATVTWREYYDLTADPWQNHNLLRDGDPGNNPDIAALSAVLSADRACSGAGCVTLAGPDNGPPGEPVNPTAGLNARGEVVVEWDPATDDVGVSGYEVTRDGQTIARLGRVVRFVDTASEPGEWHTYGVEAVDANGKGSGAVTAPPLRLPAAGSLLVDGFESGTLMGWPVVRGAFAVYGGSTGRVEARFTSSGAPSFVRATLPSAPENILIKAEVKLLSRAAEPVVLVRGMDPSGVGVVQVFVRTDGTLAYKVEQTKKIRRSGVVLPPGEWHTIGLQVVANGDASNVEVRLDGVLIAGRTETAGIVPIGRIQLGDHLYGRTYDVGVDDVVVRRFEV